MKKLFSLIRACMSSDMALFKIKGKNKKSNIILPLFIGAYLAFMIWSGANSFFERLAPMNIAYILLPIAICGISLMTFIEGIYKSGPIMFNCKDDQLLLSLPLKRRTVLFVRVLKFYIFELMFNSLFLIPVMIAYIRWGNVNWTYYLTCIVMLFTLPIIPIVASCFIGAITSGLSSKFKYKNAIQIVLSMAILVGVFYVSFRMENVFEYVLANVNTINDFIMKRYYPAGVFANLVTNFQIKDLLIFVGINIALAMVSILVLGKFYFKINSRLKNIKTSSNKAKLKDLKYRANSPMRALMKKELGTFFKIPVFIVNAGFGLVLFIILVIMLILKLDGALASIADEETGLGLAKELITNNLSLIIFALVTFTAVMTSITCSMISLEGKNISILKSLPVKTKTILMSKVYTALLITVPVLILGDIALFIKFRTNILEAFLLVLLSILMPLANDILGTIINLKYPKLDWDNPAEAIKQSTSSFIATFGGMVVAIFVISFTFAFMGKILPIWILLITTLIMAIMNVILYLYLSKKSVKDFDDLSL